VPNESQVRSGEIPSLPPGGRTNSGAQTRDRLMQPSTGPSGLEPPGTATQGKNPSFTPRDFSSPKAVTPPIGNRDRGSQRNDQPTFPGVGSKSGGGNMNPSQPQSQPQRGSGRQEGGGSAKEDSKKGKGRG
jgi:hypothetical protein